MALHTWLTAALVATAAPVAGDAMTVSPAAQQWLAVLDQADVEHRWLPGVHVDWRTGQADGKPEKDPAHATHCSAFVAALAEQEKVPLLRPPEHATHQLANAQFDWLVETGPQQGWVAVSSPLEAQQRANRGEWVLAVYRAQHEGKHGHIAVVRPAARTAASLEADGPQVTQAGKHNHQSTTLADGFSEHPRAWGKREVRFFAHPLSLP